MASVTLRENEKSYLWIDPEQPQVNQKAINLLREKGIEFEIVEIRNPDGDTHLPAFFPNKQGEAPVSSLAEIYAYVNGY